MWFIKTIYEQRRVAIRLSVSIGQTVQPYVYGENVQYINTLKL